MASRSDTAEVDAALDSVAPLACESCNWVTRREDTFSGVRCVMCPRCDNGSLLLTPEQRLKRELARVIAEGDKWKAEADTLYTTAERIAAERDRYKAELDRIGAKAEEIVARAGEPPIDPHREHLEAENQRLREAIADALADLTPGYSPHGLLTAALDPKTEEENRG